MAFPHFDDAVLSAIRLLDAIRLVEPIVVLSCIRPLEHLGRAICSFMLRSTRLPTLPANTWAWLSVHLWSKVIEMMFGIVTCRTLARRFSETSRSRSSD